MDFSKNKTHFSRLTFPGYTLFLPCMFNVNLRITICMKHMKQWSVNMYLAVHYLWIFIRTLTINIKKRHCLAICFILNVVITAEKPQTLYLPAYKQCMVFFTFSSRHPHSELKSCLNQHGTHGLLYKSFPYCRNISYSQISIILHTTGKV
jgi:hypothetical protein